MDSNATGRVYSPDLRGVARLMSDDAADTLDYFRYCTADMLLTVAAWHAADESGQYCETCWDHGDDFKAAWPCDTYQAGMTLGLQWLMRRPVGGGDA